MDGILPIALGHPRAAEFSKASPRTLGFKNSRFFEAPVD
jgi:hypothetical protein